MSSDEKKVAKTDEEKNEKKSTKTDENEEEIGHYLNHFPPFVQLILDIDLNDPEVEAAAAKIQSAFKFRMKGKKN